MSDFERGLDGSESRSSDENDVGFTFYEVSLPVPSARWIGSHGNTDERLVSVEVVSVIDGIEISVETLAATDVPSLSHRRSSMLLDLVGPALSSTLEAPEWPLTLIVDEEERRIDLHNEPCSFRGYSVNSHGWIGSTTLDDGRMVIVSAPGGVQPTRLEAMRDMREAGFGPEADQP